MTDYPVDDIDRLSGRLIDRVNGIASNTLIAPILDRPYQQHPRDADTAGGVNTTLARRDIRPVFPVDNIGGIASPTNYCDEGYDHVGRPTIPCWPNESGAPPYDKIWS